jgi:hypothetical protein
MDFNNKCKKTGPFATEEDTTKVKYAAWAVIVVAILAFFLFGGSK